MPTGITSLSLEEDMVFKVCNQSAQNPTSQHEKDAESIEAYSNLY